MRPRLAFIPLVFSAPFLAASTAACKSPCVSFRVSKKGNSASINVRSPGLAGVYFDKDCWAAIAAVYQSCLVTGRGDAFSAHLRRARDNALKNMLRIHVSAAYPFHMILANQYIAPEVPSILLSIASATFCIITAVSPSKKLGCSNSKTAGEPSCN